ncbi:valine--tRNA ligase [Campylobacter sp. MIT 12-8780]|uniref:valine--tRNA ligase n=1 Tax=unclassified Campylobacter TaxID=2593542 RepID=UPI00115EAA2C|nr:MULTISPECIES: valine--tRNA ligase [unclassified Campylobacter]NDJ26399.1 valine--tRNA ligase [Campylobacter sp. MIT 19-121]TQR42976.1 valine--tRNA ligase [Campylobacter sp. MIT 12-8780]
MYDKSVEQEYYKICEERGYFEVDGNLHLQSEGKNFCIMMPPPNVTGVLHIGHALTFSLQDIITRYKRMDGFRVLYQPGLDHAGIATQNVVEKQLLAQGIKKEQIGREEFIKKVWQWKEQSGGKIVEQMRTLGISPAWSRLRFTMDQGLANAVKKAFISLYDQGLIFRGDRMINWCCKDGALSDIEVEYKENKGKLYHLRYFLKESKDYLVVATTRPETYFGDTAVMVNPNDERYKHLIGKKLILPLVGKELKIIADEHVDMDFGTGVVKVTPAHDHNDYEVGLRHNLEFITIFDEKGILNEHCLQFKGLERLEARALIINELEKHGFVEKIEDYDNQIGLCYRCKNVVEPYISKQWFVSAKVAKESIERVNAKEMCFFPSHWINSFNAWMRDLKDWCISRQLWWGHQIPVFYCECGAEFVSQNTPHECPKCKGVNFKQDQDVLDTWFSSGLWAMSTLGWGNEGWGEGKLYQKEDLKDFYPNSLLITGFDILFFWVARMLFQSTNALHELPFKQVYLHALVKDELGRKMSKSLGNVIDPNELIKEYSADILRFTLAISAVQGRDIRLSNDKLMQIRNFTNKLYNATNYLLLNEKSFAELEKIELKSELGLYMQSRLEACIKELRANLEQYRFNDAANTLYRFFWDEFCDWGIELSKAEKSSVKELGSIFKEALKLLNPFMPFISEYLYHKLSNTELANSPSLMIAKFPRFKAQNEKSEKLFNLVIESIVSIRRAKALIDQSKIKKAFIKLNDISLNEALKAYTHFISLLSKSEEVEFITEKISNASADVSENLSVFIPLENVDLSAVLQRLENQKLKIEKEQSKLENMLKNEKFISKAPKEVITQNQEALNALQAQLEKIELELENLKGKNDRD